MTIGTSQEKFTHDLGDIYNVEHQILSALQQEQEMARRLERYAPELHKRAMQEQEMARHLEQCAPGRKSRALATRRSPSNRFGSFRTNVTLASIAAIRDSRPKEPGRFAAER